MTTMPLDEFLEKNMFDMFDAELGSIKAFSTIAYNMTNKGKTNNRNWKVINDALEKIMVDITAGDSSRKDLLYFYKDALLKKEYTIRELKEDFYTFLIAGNGTTSSTIYAALYFIKRQPEVEEKLKSEIIKTFGENIDFSKDVTAKKLTDMEYLGWVVKETIRYENVSANTLIYIALEDITIRGVNIPKGTNLMPGLSGIHMNPKVWFEPERFYPDRFDPTNEYYKMPNGEKRGPYCYAPFHIGSRACIGQNIANLQAKFTIVYVLMNLDFELKAEIKNAPYKSFNFLSKNKLLINVK
jgi:cytochrome P450